MHETLMTPLPASWLASRLRIDSSKIEQLRERGEVFAIRDTGSDEGSIPCGNSASVAMCRGVRDAVVAAREAVLEESRLLALLRRCVGLMGGGRFLDLLFEDRSDTVVAAIRSAVERA
ncbi:MAG: hypothetical protein H0W90_05625 [Actinobacteria bacterium]|nr:hypothetical protein [Actinomycetota bacterium]